MALCQYNSDADQGLALLEDLLSEIPRERYPGLAGRSEWIAGSIDKIQARIQSSVRRYERSASALHRSGGEIASAFVSVLLAESYSHLGEHSLGWLTRMAAFHAVPFAEGPRRNVAMWGEAKWALIRQGDLALAGPFVHEEVAAARQWGRPLGLATAYLDRAAYWLAIGARNNALADGDRYLVSSKSDGFLRMAISNDLPSVQPEFHEGIEALDHLSHIGALAAPGRPAFQAPHLAPEVRTGHPICNQVLFVA